MEPPAGLEKKVTFTFNGGARKDVQRMRESQESRGRAKKRKTKKPQTDGRQG